MPRHTLAKVPRTRNLSSSRSKDQHMRREFLRIMPTIGATREECALLTREPD